MVPYKNIFNCFFCRYFYQICIIIVTVVYKYPAIIILTKRSISDTNFIVCFICINYKILFISPISTIRCPV